MKRINILATLLIWVAVATQAQTILFSCDFEEGIPATFATYDMDGNAPSRSMKSYGLTDGVAWAAYTDTIENNTAAYSGSWYKTPGQSNDWMVTSAIRVEDVRNILSWNTRALSTTHPDGYAVYISTQGNTPSDFVDAPVYVVDAERGQWQQHAISLADWVGEEIYIAFVNNSTNCNILALDDINIFSYEHSFVVTNTTPNAIATPQAVYVSGEITSSGFMPVEGYVVELTYNGQTTIIDRSTDIIASDSVATFAFQVPIDVPLDATRDYSLRISSLGGNDVMEMACSITCFERLVLLEEGTGTWCMYCPRGTVGIEMLHEKYPGRLIDVAVHGGADPMMYVPYYVGTYPYFQGSFPNSVFDRCHDLVGDPYFDGDSLMTVAMNRGAIGKIETTAHFNANNQLQVEATVEFGKVIGEGEYGLLYIIVEDSVTGYEQANAFSGNMEEMGGYEKLPDPIPAGEYYFANVARSLYPSFGGDATAFTAGTPRHTPMTVAYTIDMPEVQRYDMVKVIAAITEIATGEIVNACQVIPSWPEAIDDVDADNTIVVNTLANGIEIVAHEALQAVEVWSVAGQLLYVAQPHCNTHTIALDNYHGVVVVKACTTHDSVVVKCVK